MVRVAIEVGDDDFLADARDGHVAPERAGDFLRHPYPAGAVLVVAAFPVPGELHLHSAKFVAVDFLALALALALARALGLLVVQRVLEVVVALGLARGAHVLAVSEAAQRRARAVAAGLRVVLHRQARLFAENPQAVAVDEAVAFGVVQEAVEKAFLAHDALDEVVVGAAGLHAVLARSVGVGDLLLVVQGDGVLLQYGGGDVGHGQGLEDAPVRGQLQAGQARLDDGAVASAAKAGVALLERGHRAMHVAHGLAALPDSEERRTVEDLAEVDGGVGAAELDIEVEGLGEAFDEVELDDLERVGAGAGGEGEAQIASDGHAVLPAGPAPRMLEREPGRDPFILKRSAVTKAGAHRHPKP